MAKPIPLSARQHARALAFLQDPGNHGRGYKAALDAAGITYGNTSANARATIEHDPELHEAWADARRQHLDACGLGEHSIFQNVGRIAGNLDHKDALRANTWAAAVLHGISEKQQVELTGADGGPVETVDRSASLDDVRRILDTSLGSAAADAEVADA